MSRGKFITLEGSEGAGKSSAITFLKDYLNHAHIDIHWTREPGGSALAEDIRALLLHAKDIEPMSAKTELLLMFAAREQHLQTILPALAAGKWVISDRFIDASYAYQGGGRHIPERYIEFLEEWIVGNHLPDLTLLLDLPPEIGLQRTQKREGQADRIEREKLDFFINVRQGYLARAKKFPERIKIIDATQSEIAVQQQIKNLLDDFIMSHSQ